jgi:hypothetical protein
MRKPANDFRSPDDWDDAERLEIEVKGARVRADALKYQGRPNLLELAIEVSRELAALNRELVIAQRERRPKAERVALLDRDLLKAREFAAIDMAMDEATRAKFLAMAL